MIIWQRLRGEWPVLTPAFLLAFLFWKPATQGPTTCPFALITGHACPLCGGTRAAAAMFKGDMTLAWAMHPLVFLIVPLMIAGWVRWLGVRSGRRQPLSVRTINQITAGLGVLFLALWIVRGLSGTLPPI